MIIFILYKKILREKNRIYIDPERTNVAIFDSINSNVRITSGVNISTQMKAVKNETELENERKAYLIDGVSLIKFFNWVEVGTSTGSLTELITSKKIARFKKRK